MASRHDLFHRENRLLRLAVENSATTYRFTSHARDEMRNDGIFTSDVRYVIARGRVTWLERKKDELWHVEGKDTDERSIRVVVAYDAAESEIKIVTAMELRRQVGKRT